MHFRRSLDLLAGRARQAELFPLTFHEIQDFRLAAVHQGVFVLHWQSFLEKLWVGEVIE